MPSSPPPDGWCSPIPPEFFDVLIVDECHRSIYSVWGDVLKYFDAFLIGLTATPSKQTIGFFNQNLVMEYTHEQAVADRVNVPYDVYEIRTRIIDEHKDELTALQVFFGMATPDRLKFRDLKELADQIKRPPVSTTPEELWRCYEALEAAKVAGKGGQIITDLVSLIRHTLQPSEPLTPFADVVRQRYQAWRSQQAAAGVTFTAEQAAWLDKIAEHIATSLAIEMEDFHDGWFAQRRNLGKAYELFGDRLPGIIDEMNKALTAVRRGADLSGALGIANGVVRPPPKAKSQQVPDGPSVGLQLQCTLDPRPLEPEPLPHNGLERCPVGGSGNWGVLRKLRRVGRVQEMEVPVVVVALLVKREEPCRHGEDVVERVEACVVARERVQRQHGSVRPGVVEVSHPRRRADRPAGEPVLHRTFRQKLRAGDDPEGRVRDRDARPGVEGIPRRRRRGHPGANAESHVVNQYSLGPVGR